MPVPHPSLPADRLEPIEGFGGSVCTMGYVYRPSTVAGVREVFALAKAHGRTVVLRGAGRSYGDAAVNPEGVVLDLTRLCRILAWDPAEGVIECEGGVTLAQIWQYALGDGWWLPVVSGTTHPTLGGALGANIHGKNNLKAGVLGEHVLWFELLTPAGALVRCSREERPDLFHAALGGFGLLGVIVRAALRLKRVHAGLVDVQAAAAPNLRAMLHEVGARAEAADYAVGWVDAFASGEALGRGIVHEARHLRPGDDPAPAQSLRAEAQALPEAFFGVVPKRLAWLGLRLFLFDAGMRLVNFAKWFFGQRAAKPYRQSHAAFNFLLDAMPGWQRAYRPGGLLQFQTFIPRDKAEAVFARQLSRAQIEGFTPYLAVVKRHRADPFLLSHGVDGFSLALDFKVTRRNREGLTVFLRSLAREAVAAGGRFYLAKDQILTAEIYAASLPAEALAAFHTLKVECDPEGILGGAMARRLFPGIGPRAPGTP